MGFSRVELPPLIFGITLLVLTLVSAGEISTMGIVLGISLAVSIIALSAAIGLESIDLYASARRRLMARCCANVFLVAAIQSFALLMLEFMSMLK